MSSQDEITRKVKELREELAPKGIKVVVAFQSHAMAHNWTTIFVNTENEAIIAKVCAKFGDKVSSCNWGIYHGISGTDISITHESGLDVLGKLISK